MGKIQTPDWILKGKEKPQKAKPKSSASSVVKSKPKVKSEKTYKIRVCPKCGSDDVAVVLVGEEGRKADNWECKKCKWNGKNIGEKEISEDEFLERAEKK